jgi:hypothetical protein
MPRPNKWAVGPNKEKANLRWNGVLFIYLRSKLCEVVEELLKKVIVLCFSGDAGFLRECNRKLCNERQHGRLALYSSEFRSRFSQRNLMATGSKVQYIPIE